MSIVEASLWMRSGRLDLILAARRPSSLPYIKRGWFGFDGMRIKLGTWRRTAGCNGF